MPNLHYDSLHKFFISLGTTFIVLPFVVDNLLFNQSSKLLFIDEDQFGKLIKPSQEIITIKQNFILHIISSDWYYVLTVVSILIGIAVIVHGYDKWSEIQKKLDELQNGELDDKLRLMSKKEQETKVEEKIINDKKLLGNKKNSTVYEYMKIEEELFERINKIMGNMYRVVQNVRIGHFGYDITAISNSPLQRDYIFEIKPLKGPINNKWIKYLSENIERQISNYSENTKHKDPYGIIIIVTEDENYNKVNDEINRNSKKDNYEIIVTQRSKIKDLELKI